MSAPDHIAATTTLNCDIEMPWLGLGTYLMHGDEAYRAVTAALEAGYRHIDTAAFYDNEEKVGRAIRDSGVPRDDVFVTTKLWNTDHGEDSAREAFQRSRDRLDVGVIDLYLIHWPVPDLRMDSWQTLEEIFYAGECRAIGVSNYTTGHLDEVLTDGDVVPAVNQVEFSPFLYQRELLRLCSDRGVQLVAYSPLTKGERLDDPALIAVAEANGRSRAQVLIRWCLQKGVAVIPKSASPERVRENADVFDWSLSDGDVERLDGLHENLRTSWDPTHER